MSGFTSEALEKKLLDLNNSQQSIQTLSLWLIHHRKHNAAIVQTWFKELKKAKQNRKLTFMYLANDVIQNSRKKGPEFTKEFSTVLRAAFENVAKESDEKTWSGLDRILAVWKERAIYDSDLIHQFKSAIGIKKQSKDNSNKNSKDGNLTIANNKNGKKEEKFKREKVPEINRGKRDKEKSSKSAPDLKKRKPNVESKPDTVITDSSGKMVNEINANLTTSALLSNSSKTTPIKFLTPIKLPITPIKTVTPEKQTFLLQSSVNGDGLVDTETLIKYLQQLENSASSDAAVRENIASLPPEISDLSLLDSLRDKGAAEKLSEQVEEACILLNDYNNRLSQEIEDRKQISNLLSSYVKNQKDILCSVEEKLTDFKEKLRKMMQVKHELQSHLQNLPDLSLLPSVTGGLAPLPSAGDLFNVHAAARNNQLNINNSKTNNNNSNSNDNKLSIESSGNTSPNTVSPADYETVNALTPTSSNEESLHQQS